MSDERKDYEFSIYLNVFDPPQLRAAALAHPDTQPDDTFTNEDGSVDVPACLIQLLDPGSLPGCSIYDSTAEHGET